MALCLDILIWQAHVNSTLLWGSNPVGLEFFLQAFFQTANAVVFIAARTDSISVSSHIHHFPIFTSIILLNIVFHFILLHS